jgi:GMP synthase (glutamine-hydrolysing)
MATGAPYLILDCYLDERGGARNLVPLLAGRPCEVVRAARAPLPRDASGWAGVLVSGSAASLVEPPAWCAPLIELLADARRRGTPTLGICFGLQAIAAAVAGPGAVRRSPTPELGWEEIERFGEDELAGALPRRFRCFVSHLDEVAPSTPGLEVFARSRRCDVHGFRVRGAPMWGVQFHPEMPPEESEEVLRSGLGRHPHLGPDPAPLLSDAVDGRPLGAALVARFVARVERGSPGSTSGTGGDIPPKAPTGAREP